MIPALIQRWQACSRRERSLLIGCLSLVLGGLVWGGIVSPLRAYQANQQRLAIRAAADLQWIVQHRGRIETLRQSQLSETQWAVPLEAALQQSSQAHSVTMKQVIPREPYVDVQLAPLSFNTLLIWLLTLEKQYGIQVQEIELTPETLGSGRVNVHRLSLSRATP